MRRRRGEEKTDQEKMRDRLEIITRESRLLRVVKSEECNVKCQRYKMKYQVLGQCWRWRWRRWGVWERSWRGGGGGGRRRGHKQGKTRRKMGFRKRKHAGEVFFTNWAFPYLTIYRQLMAVDEQKEGSEIKRAKEDELRRKIVILKVIQLKMSVIKTKIQKAKWIPGETLVISPVIVRILSSNKLNRFPIINIHPHFSMLRHDNIQSFIKNM
jgi:hypothetical protein